MGNRGKKVCPSPVKLAAIKLGIPVYTTQSIRNDKNTINIIKNFNADVYIVVAFGQILPKEIIFPIGSQELCLDFFLLFGDCRGL